MTFEEKTIDTELIYEGAILNLRKDKVEVMNGTSYREIIEHNGGSVILAMKEDGTVIMVKQYRKAQERIMLEVPAGKIDPGEKPLDAAVRELREETGYTAKNIRLLSEMMPTPGYSEEILYIYLATELTAGETDFDDNEAIDNEEYHINELHDMVMNGSLKDGKSQVAILMAKNLYDRDLV